MAVSGVDFWLVSTYQEIEQDAMIMFFERLTRRIFLGDYSHRIVMAEKPLALAPRLEFCYYGDPKTLGRHKEVPLTLRAVVEVIPSIFHSSVAGNSSPVGREHSFIVLIL